MSKALTISFASVYPHYVEKVEKKGRTNAELNQVIEWLTGFDDVQGRAVDTGGMNRESTRPASPF